MKQFGTFAGVFVPSFEALFGAVLFLILPMLVAEMGITHMLLIVFIANTATLATAFSISDCATNLNNIGGGGMYAIAKRSLGKAFGGSIGIQLYLAQAVSIGFYALGFADPLQKILIQIPLIERLAGEFGLSVLEQKQIIGTLVALAGFVAGLVGADFVSKIQMIIFVVLTAAVGTLIVSPFFGVRYGDALLFTQDGNFGGSGVTGLGFWAAFAIFFPAVTGIDAGVGMSGNLREPRKSLVKGTFLAIAVTGIGYLLAATVFGFIDPETLIGSDGIALTAVDVFTGAPVIQVILLCGILFATGSSALAYFLTAPRTVQALARDDILPRFLRFLGSDFRSRGNEPRWGTVLTFCIVIPVIWAGDVAFASLIVGICFLVVYGWVNLAAFFERISGNPSFRPTSRGHWLISLYGFLIAIIVISLFNPFIGIGVAASQLGIFLLLLKYRSQNRLEGVWWGVSFSLINGAFKRMRRIIRGTKNWRPIVGIFCFGDRKHEAYAAMEIGRKIADFKGMTMLNVLLPEKDGIGEFIPPSGARIVSVPGDQYESAIFGIVQAAMPGELDINTVLLPMDPRVNLVALIESIMHSGRNVLMYKEGGIPDSGTDRIDVWWKGEENGNMMALLSYIMVQSDVKEKRPKKQIRLIRRIRSDEDAIEAQRELAVLMQGARLAGDILILPDDGKPIHDTIRSTSTDAALILIGMPGRRMDGIARLFSLDRLFFSRELEKFKNFPPILFVKAAGIIDLFE